MMWKILISIMVLVPLTKQLPQNLIHTNLLNRTSTKFLNKIGMLGDKIIFEVNNIRNKLPALLSDEPSKPLSLNDLRSCPVCKCGLQGNKGKIVGGTQVEYAHKYPWMAYYQGQFFCGAALINDRYVVTAAHCISPNDLATARVRLYEHDLENNVDNIYQFKIRRIIIHEKYNIRPHDNDIALLRLDVDGGVPMSDNLLPICMPNEGLSYKNQLGTATGWGKLNYWNPIKPLVLREVTVPIMDNASCVASDNRVTENMICAGLPEGGKDTCQGDSGGPLTVTNGTVYRLVGITSWGNGCGDPYTPGVYVKVTNYLKWIKENTLDACWCGDF